MSDPDSTEPSSPMEAWLTDNPEATIITFEDLLEIQQAGEGTEKGRTTGVMRPFPKSR
jgi:hypothetical protein